MKLDMEKLRREYEIQKAAEKVVVDTLLAKGEFLDEDGYPTRDALTVIELWPHEDPIGWFTFINSLWHLKSWGWDEEVIDLQVVEGYAPMMGRPAYICRYNISTAGWSGNESIIRAMEENDSLWHFHWEQTRRGGHYIFEVELDDQATAI